MGGVSVMCDVDIGGVGVVEDYDVIGADAVITCWLCCFGDSDGEVVLVLALMMSMVSLVKRWFCQSWW
jgi:hypothetical protein